MTEDQAYELLNRIFADVFGRGDIVLEPALTARDVVGWDSFRQVEIIMAIEEALGFRFTSREIDGLQNVGDLAKVMLSRANAATGGKPASHAP